MNNYINNIDKKEKYHLLDPMSTIIKLIIVGFKQVNSKLSIANNTINIQEPNILQPAYRYFQGDNKVDLHYLSYPIDSACSYFLVSSKVGDDSKGIVFLFEKARNGIQKLMETYKDHSLIIHCLKFYDYIIEFHLDNLSADIPNSKKPPMLNETSLPSDNDNQITKLMNDRWTDEKIKILIELVHFIVTQKGEYYNDYLKSLENFMIPIDKESQTLINTFYSN